LKRTHNSLQKQNFKEYEWLVCDGGSTDGTLEYLQDTNAQIVSKEDSGIYDAMNKGLELATGDFIWFMNCGDQVYDRETVANMVATCRPQTDVLYGKVMYVDEHRRALGLRSELTPHRLPEQLHWRNMAKGMVVSHQAFLPHRDLWVKYVYDNLTADVDWVIRCLKKSRHPQATQLVLATFLVGGLSKQKHQQSLWDRYGTLRQHFGFWPNLWNHGWIVGRAIWFKIKRWGKPSY
ncbi:MAG: glycosyltransferase, partial [Bacteroidota bacterium]